MNYDKAREIMVDTQVRPNDVSNPEIVSAFMKTPREAFVPSSRKSVAYSELEIETSEGRSLWTPRDTGKLVKLAGIKPTDIVLVVGAGSGYEAALISRLAEVWSGVAGRNGLAVWIGPYRAGWIRADPGRAGPRRKLLYHDPALGAACRLKPSNSNAQDLNLNCRGRWLRE